MHDLNAQQLKHHAAIGGVALTWTHLENYVQSILWRMTKLPPNIGRCITHHMPFRSLCDAIITIANESPEYRHLAADFDASFRQCDQLRTKRNDIVHALWATFLHPAGDDVSKTDVQRADEVEGMIIKARGRLKIKINSTTASEINDVVDEIQTFHRNLAGFVTPSLPADA
jgi:hypothetical protein